MSGPAAEERPQLTRLPSGVRVVTEAVPSVRSVALGLWVATGSRHEPAEQAGVSHFLEHLLFKGTESMSAIEINEAFDAMGASVNASTGKESTSLYCRCLDEHTDRALGLLAEMLLGPVFPPEEVDSERQVVLEEIAMYEDEPADTVHDVLGEAVFGDHPLGRRVIGRAEVISSIPIPEIGAYHRRRYAGAGIVVAAAGNLDHGRVCELVESALAPKLAAAEGDGDGAAPEIVPRARFESKETEQYHLCLGGPGLVCGDDRRFALGVLDGAFGGSMSSRLFREVREKRGLAYAVGSYTQEYADSGKVAVFLGTRADRLSESMEVIGGELARLCAEGVEGEELERAREQIKGRLVLSAESTSARMSRIARAVLFDIELLTLDETLERIEAVSPEDTSKLARELYDPGRLSAACIGADEESFRSALAPVSEALAAA